MKTWRTAKPCCDCVAYACAATSLSRSDGRHQMGPLVVPIFVSRMGLT